MAGDKNKKKALDAPTYTGFLVDPDEIMIETDPSSPFYDPQATETGADERIARQFLRRTVLQEVLGKKIERDGKELVVALDGRHRILNARLANKIAKQEGLDTIRVRVRLQTGNDRELAGQVLATDVRKKFDAIKHAEKIQRYIDGGHTVEEAADELCISVAAVQNRLSLLQLSEAARQAVKDGYVSFTEAVEELKDKTIEEQASKISEWKFARTKVEAFEREDGTKGERVVVTKTRAKKTRPGKKLIRKAYDFLVEQDTVKAKIQAQLLGWTLGEVSAKNVAEVIEGFPIPEKKPRKKKAKAKTPAEVDEKTPESAAVTS